MMRAATPPTTPPMIAASDDELGIKGKGGGEGSIIPGTNTNGAGGDGVAVVLAAGLGAGTDIMTYVEKDNVLTEARPVTGSMTGSKGC